MAVQYSLNGRRKFNKGDIDNICNSEEPVWGEQQECVEINGKTSDLPNGWKERVTDWNNTKELMGEC